MNWSEIITGTSPAAFRFGLELSSNCLLIWCICLVSKRTFVITKFVCANLCARNDTVMISVEENK